MATKKFFQAETILTSHQKRRIEKTLKYKNMEVDSPYDIAVNKVHTIAMKPRARDFLDIYF